MQNIVLYVAANQMLGTVKDYANARTIAAPQLVKGIGCTLKMRVFRDADGQDPYPISLFSSVTSWDWIMDTDFNEATAPKLRADIGGITIASVTETIGDEQYTFTEFSIPITNMATTSLYSWLGTEEYKSGLHGELVGTDALTNTVFVLQVKNFTVRNRLGSAGVPTPVSPDYLTEAQVRALVQSGFVCQFSSDLTNWHSTQANADIAMRFRIAGETSSAYSTPILLVAGQQGTPGTNGVNAYCYVAYASDNAGTGFSLTPNNNLKYRAEIHTTAPIATPMASDFANAAWVKYIGDDGRGVGDMLKSIYDTDNDGKVDDAEHADSADSADEVAWNDITGKPEQTRQYFTAVSNGTTLYTKLNILRNSSLANNNSLVLDFRTILDDLEGSAVEGVAGDMFTWEYHVRATQRLTNISIGSAQSTMEGVNIPSELDLINNNTTWHVFTVRAMYKSNAVNKLALVVNYSYSYKD